MVLANEIFDSELNRRVLVDHAFTVADGEIQSSTSEFDRCGETP